MSGKPQPSASWEGWSSDFNCRHETTYIYHLGADPIRLALCCDNCALRERIPMNWFAFSIDHMPASRHKHILGKLITIRG